VFFSSQTSMSDPSAATCVKLRAHALNVLALVLSRIDYCNAVDYSQIYRIPLHIDSEFLMSSVVFIIQGAKQSCTS